MSAFFVTGAGTEIGKTHVACALLAAWRAQGLPCAALKPVVSGYSEAAFADSDPARLLAALGAAATPERIARIAPWRFAAPLAPPLAARAEGARLDLEEIAGFCRAQLRVGGGAMLIEGAGGVMAPLTDTHTSLDLIAALGLPSIFVAGSYLGAVSHALTSLEALAVRSLPVAAVVVCESAESAGLADACAMIRTHCAAAVIPAPRGATDWAGRLVEALR